MIEERESLSLARFGVRGAHLVRCSKRFRWKHASNCNSVVAYCMVSLFWSICIICTCRCPL